MAAVTEDPIRDAMAKVDRAVDRLWYTDGEDTRPTVMAAVRFALLAVAKTGCACSKCRKDVRGRIAAACGKEREG